MNCKDGVCTFKPRTEKKQESCDNIIATNKVVIFTMDNCPYCLTAKSIIKQYTTNYKEVMYENHISTWIINKTGRTSLPVVFINGEYIGGCNDGGIGGVCYLHTSGLLDDMI